MHWWPRADGAAWRGLLRYGAPALILALALGLRLWRLGGANLWWDEALAIWGVRKGLLGVTLWTASDVHPPLYFWSLWAWVQAFGESEFAMRSLTAFVGVLTVAVVYALGRLAAGRTAGALGALFIALARFHIWWSQEMRMYALAGLLGTCSLYLFLRWLRAEGQYSAATDVPPERITAPWLLAGTALAALGALYTIFISAVFVLVENVLMLAVLWRPRGGRPARKRLFWRWALAQLAILALLIVWLAVSWGRMRSWSVGEPASATFVAQLYATLLATGVSVNIDQVSWAIWPPLAVLAGGLACGLARRGPGGLSLAAVLAGLVVVLGGAIIYVATQPRGLFYVPRLEARYFLPFAPAYWLLLGWSAAALIRWRAAVGWAAAALLVGVSVYFLPGYYGGRIRHDELQSMVRAILGQAEPSDVVLLDSGGRYPVFLYHYERAAGDADYPPMETITREERHITAEEVAERMAAKAADHPRIWLAEVEVSQTDPDRLVKAWLDAHGTVVWAQSYGYNALYLYDATGAAPKAAAGYVPQYPLAADLGGGQLRGWELAARTVTPGEVLHVVTVWNRAPTEPVWLELRTAAGETVLRRGLSMGASDSGPWRQEEALAVAAGWANGRYRLALATADMTLDLGSLRVAQAAASPALAAAAVPLGAHIGDALALEGYTLHDRSIAAGGTITLDLYWRAETAPGRDLAVFTHLLGEAVNPATQGPVWGQTDGAPGAGAYATGAWRAGDVLIDRHVIAVDAAAPAGKYQIEVGLVDPGSGARLPVADADGSARGDSLVLPETVDIAAP